MTLLRALLCLVLLALPATAQDRPRTILVLDASGSMWGQIDGKTKIEIAQSVVGDLLDEIPADQQLGLTAYGHNRKGDCSDIETLVQPGENTRDAIRAAVNAIKPKGKTPLSEAVIQAAEALKYTEEAATVILVSDGRETCEFDPCEVGKRLEEAGVNFTAHVVGFDVANPADRAQLQCLAENTGGKFITAANASELTTALQEVAAPPPPVELYVTFAAVTKGTTTRITDGLVWSLTAADGTTLADFETAPSITRTLGEGTYLAEVLRPSDEATAEVTVTIGANSATTVLLELPEFTPKASLEAADTAEVLTNLAVTWTGPNEAGDQITVAEIGAPPSRHLRVIPTGSGNPVLMQMPADAGQYQLRYVWRGRVIATRVVEVTPVQASLDAADTAVAGSTLSVTWDGPNRDGDYISIAEIGARQNSYRTYAYTRDGQTLGIQVPIVPGQYELRYVLNQGPRVLAKKLLTVTEVSASVTAPAQAPAGATVTVDWTGPDYRNDYISVAEIGSRGNRYAGYTYTREGAPLALRMPSEPGDYEIRYIANQNATILARQTIKVVAVEATVNAPSEAAAGDTVVVEWTGPDYQNDYISVAKIGDKGNKYETYTYTRKGSPLQLKMPAAEGDYEIRYVQNQNSTVLARQPIKVMAVAASLSAPDSAAAGSTVVVEWTGPDYQNDYISVAKIGDKGNRYETYTYTRKGSPLQLKMPAAEGDYEIRYVQNQGNRVLATKPVRVEPVGASLTFDAEADVGEPLLVQWEGPNYQNDYISVAEVGAREDRYVNYTYTREGSPLRLKMPLKPGSYEIRYIQNQGKKVLMRMPVTVVETTVAVSAADTAKAGEPLLVQWEGPGYQNDYLSVAAVGSKDTAYINYTYARDGSPLRLAMPVEPGQYEIRYVAQGNPDVVLARRSVTVEPVEASVTLSGSAKAGEPALVEWTGPDYQGDYIAVSVVGDGGYEAYTYTRDGSPLRVNMPKQPGTYELRYVMRQDNTVVARTTITVE